MILVGLPGSGKSTIGRLLAQRLQYQYLDTDDWIERAAGKSVLSIFESAGEDEFRKLEAKALVEALLCQLAVIATGGGIILSEENRVRMIGSGQPIIYLKADIHSIAKRLRSDMRRPLMHNHDPVVRLRELELIRHPLYEEVATQTIDCTKKSATAIINAIMMTLQLGHNVVPY